MKAVYRLFFICLFIFSSSAVYSQISSDPNHEFYKSVQKWEINNYVDNLPPVRPYPVIVIKALLQQAIENGDENTVQTAQEYWKEVTGKPWAIDVIGDVNAKYAEAFNKGAAGTVAATGDVLFLNDLVSIGYKVGFDGYTELALDYLKNFQSAYAPLPRDTLYDPSEISLFKVYFDVNDSVAVGKENYYLQMGVTRLGFGPFIGEGLALNEAAYHCSNLGFTYRNNRFNYSQVYAAIGASKSYDGSGLVPDKYLAFHQFSYNILKNLSLTYYENIVYGNRFDFSYIIPAPYMTLQSIGGFDDNLQMGIQLIYKPVKGLMIGGDIFVDDISVNDVMKFDFDTKIRVAGSVGAVYYPPVPVLEKIKLIYTVVTPYTYSHWQIEKGYPGITQNTSNFQNYTNSCIQMGSQLDPNSDSVKVSFELNPVRNMDLNLNFSFTRHGNISETLPANEAVYYLMCDENIYATDGTIYQHTVVDMHNEKKEDYLFSAWNDLNFLNQKHIMSVFQTGIGIAYKLPEYKWGKLSFKINYIGEYIHNKGVDSHMLPGISLKYDKASDKYIYNGTNYSAEEIVQKFKNQWVSNLKDVWNNYLDIGFEYKF